MSKLTLHERAREGFLCAVRMQHYAERLERDAKDFGWSEAKSLAKEMKETAEEYTKKLK